MKTIDKLNNSKIPVVAFDKKLEKLTEVVLFPKKLEDAQRILKKAGLPEKTKA